MGKYEFFSFLASGCTLLSYVLYFRGILYFGTIPHVVTWLSFTLFSAIAFLGQLAGGAGVGSLPTAIGGFCCLAITVIGLRRGIKEVAAIDIFCLIAAVVAVFVWKNLENPLYAVIIVSCADVTALIPTIRKAWHDPEHETISTFLLTAIRNFLSIFAVENRNFLTMLYPSVLTISNLTFVTLTLLSRRLRKSKVEN